MHAATLDLERAEACYRKALFLEPSNEDALLHLALLLEKRGEAAVASKLRNRARRALSFHTFASP
jgi:chemotaxis protein methyltransferase WspC